MKWEQCGPLSQRAAVAERKTCRAGEGSLPGLAVRDRGGQARSDRAGFPMLAAAQEREPRGSAGHLSVQMLGGAPSTLDSGWY